MTDRIQIRVRNHPRRPFEAFVDGKSVLTFTTQERVDAWLDESGDIELLRTDLARHFESQGLEHVNADVQICGICWQCPDAWVLAAAWLAEADPAASAGEISSAVARIARELA
jgi:hypothetical protein